MDWMLCLKALFGLIAVLGLLAGLGWLLRTLKKGGHLPFGAQGKRLVRLETLYLDDSRQLVLIQQDNLTHLILLGPPDLLIHTSELAEPASFYQSNLSQFEKRMA
jgi:flagellar biogenesis protein FliO